MHLLELIRVQLGEDNKQSPYTLIHLELHLKLCHNGYH